MTEIITDNRTSFSEWLKKQPKLKAHPARIIALMDEGSSFAVAHSISRCAFWELSDADDYSSSCRKLLSSRLFHILHRKDAIELVKVYVYYKDFLIEQAQRVEQPAPAAAEKQAVTVASHKENDSAIVEKKAIIKTAETMPTVSDADTVSPSEAKLQYDFEHPQSLESTRPISLAYFDDTVIAADSWRQLFLDFLKVLYDDYPHFFSTIKEKDYGGANTPPITDENGIIQTRTPKEFTNGLFVVTNRSANDLMANLKIILDECQVDYENVVITYEQKAESAKGIEDIQMTAVPAAQAENKATIVDAVVAVLQKAEKPWTAQEIYDQIVRDGLYTFGAQDPVHVVEVKINAACRGSGYTYRAPQDLFGFVTENGQKRYFLLSRENDLQKESEPEKAADVSSFPFIRTEADKKLSEKYPVLFKRIYTVLEEYDDIRVSPQTVLEKTGRIARLSTVKHVLEYASWSEHCGDNYRFSEQPIQYSLPDEQPQSQPARSNEIAFYNWLEQNKRMSSSECGRYTSGIQVLSRLLKKECSAIVDLYAVQDRKTLAVYSAFIHKNPSFIELAKNQRDRLTSSIALYAEYLDSLEGAKTRNAAVSRAREKEFCQWAALRVGPEKARAYADKLKFIEDRCIENRLIEKPFFELDKTDDFSKVLDCAQKQKFPFILQSVTRTDVVEAIPLYYSFLHKDEAAKKTAALPKNVKVLDFTDIGDLSFTKPVRLKFLSHESTDFSSWADLYIKLLFMLRVDHPRTITAGTSLSGSSSPDVSADRDSMRAPKPIGKNLYAETNHDVKGLVNRMLEALSLCGVSQKKVEIQYLVREKSLPTKGSKKIAVDSQLMSKIIAFIKAANDGVSLSEITAKFPGIKPGTMNAMLDTDSVVLLNSKYYHKNSIEDLEEAADTILTTLRSQFLREGGYTSAKMLYDELHVRLDDFFFDNGRFDSQIELYDLTRYLFEKVRYKGCKFVFSDNKHIWESEPDYPKTYLGLMSHWAKRQNGLMTRNEIMDRLVSLGASYPASSFSALMSGSTQNPREKVFLMYDEYRYVLTEACHIDEDFLFNLRSSLEELLDGDDYLALDDIDDYFYSTLPALPSGAIWTVHMLKSVLAFYDVGFSTVAVGGENDMKTQDAALIRKNTNYKSFSDVLWAEINRDYELPKEFSAEVFREYLLHKGFIHGLEKRFSVHTTVEGDLRFFWTDNNSRVTVSKK